ncbi:hypothetical protein J6590_094204 [Homalodisca vitripennis]|nr:hypothetical protein J6590_094204 [Homalodisca vitripennis]
MGHSKQLRSEDTSTVSIKIVEEHGKSAMLPNLATEATPCAPCPQVQIYILYHELALFRQQLHCRAKNADARVCETSSL